MHQRPDLRPQARVAPFPALSLCLVFLMGYYRPGKTTFTRQCAWSVDAIKGLCHGQGVVAPFGSSLVMKEDSANSSARLLPSVFNLGEAFLILILQ